MGSKEECDVKVSKFAKKDKCGNTIPCTIPKCKTIAQYSIEDHPEYEATILKFGAIKTKCGKLQPPPKCPCIVKDKCGNYKYKPCPKQKECPVCEPADKTNKSSCEAKKYQAELIRS